jgi:2-aminoadipate transaminase
MITSTPPFDFGPFLASTLPPATKWKAFPTFNFVGGHNDREVMPLQDLLEATNAVLNREGRALSMYGLDSGPQGYRPLREFLVGKLKRHAGLTCTADEILLTSGSLQAIDLVNQLLLARGDTVIIEQDTYGGVITRFQRLGVNVVGVPLDQDGLRLDALATALDDLKTKSITPKYIYTIPTVQNPTGTIMGLERRIALLRLARTYGVPIFEDECYSDLIWDGQRPPSLYALSQQAGNPQGGVIFVGSFSKSVAPALRVGYIAAPWDIISRLLPLKTDAGSGALEQMVLAEFCSKHFDTHVPVLNAVLRRKLVTLMGAVDACFGTSAEFDDPKGGIFLWVKLPSHVDTHKLAQSALAEGVAVNPGPEWSTNAAHGRRHIRICFASASEQELRDGVQKLAEICRREFGVPDRIANIAHTSR